MCKVSQFKEEGKLFVGVASSIQALNSDVRENTVANVHTVRSQINNWHKLKITSEKLKTDFLRTYARIEFGEQRKPHIRSTSIKYGEILWAAGHKTVELYRSMSETVVPCPVQDRQVVRLS